MGHWSILRAHHHFGLGLSLLFSMVTMVEIFTYSSMVTLGELCTYSSMVTLGELFTYSSMVTMVEIQKTG